MKRFWLGFLILTMLLAGSLLIHTALYRIHTSISADLEQAALSALQKNWDDALRHARTATNRWQRYHRFTAAFADHTPMDEVDGLFSQLPVHAQQREDPHFAATCNELFVLTSAIAQSHGLNWWNLL